ncbi:FG-GAP-like repeat-containing protein [Limisphaera sp. VF-2]|uniref:FG-GAP-like repeat-containing protein n=1 Tax=Limisphaera sp. VF-2 TaxID=3400418 RepID=UPI003C15C82D
MRSPSCLPSRAAPKGRSMTSRNLRFGRLRWWSYCTNLLLIWLLGSRELRADTRPLELFESPPDSGRFVANVIGSVVGPGSEVRFWTFLVQSGDRLTAYLERTDTNLWEIDFQVLLNDTPVARYTRDGTWPRNLALENILFASGGMASIQISSPQDYTWYNLRVDLSRGPALEQEPNDSMPTANELYPARAPGGSRFQVAGALPADDPAGDWYRLGVLPARVRITAQLFTGPYSSLSQAQTPIGLYGVFNQIATPLAIGTNIDVTLTNTVECLFHVSGSQTNNAFARYLLTVFVSGLPPHVTMVGLPGSETVTADLIYSFDVHFSVPMAPDSMTNANHYDLRQAGRDGLFDTPDDIPYPLQVSWMEETRVRVTLIGSPLQAGTTRFVVKPLLRDLVGNIMETPFSRTFHVVEDSLFRKERPGNDDPARATTLGAGAPDSPAQYFQHGPVLSLASRPSAVISFPWAATGDWGLAVAYPALRSLHIMGPDGQGSITTRTNLALPEEPTFLATGDLNRDGLADLAVGTAQGGAWILLGQGDGRFAIQGQMILGGTRPDLAIADLNRDGRLDLLAVNGSGSNVMVWLNQGQATFGPPRLVPCHARVWRARVGDLNRDERPDLFVITRDPDRLLVFTGNGDGTFLSPTYHGGLVQPSGLAVTDLNSDGSPDAVVLNAGDGTVALYLGQADGTLAAPSFRPSGMPAASPADTQDLLVADLNGDARPDWAVASTINETVYITLSDFGRDWNTPWAWTNTGAPLALAYGDWNQDGYGDLVAARASPSQLAFMWGARIHELPEDSFRSGLREAYGWGALELSGDVDYWVFSGVKSQIVDVVATRQPPPTDDGLQLVLQSPSGTVLAQLGAPGRTGPVRLPETGRYFLRVHRQPPGLRSESNEYRFRVILVPEDRSPESEPNDQVESASLPTFRHLAGRTSSAWVYGLLDADHDRDVFRLHYVPPHWTTQGIELPALSELRVHLLHAPVDGFAPLLEILNASNQVVAMGAPRATNLTFRTPAAGQYFVAIRSSAFSDRIFGAYQLRLETWTPSDTTSPVLVEDNLPQAGQRTTNAYAMIRLTFSEELIPDTVNNPAHYELRSAGDDGLFDTSDDIRYDLQVWPPYLSGTNVTLLNPGSPLPAGHYRFVVTTNLKDWELNPLAAPVVRIFEVQPTPGLILEQGPNDVRSSATSLGSGVPGTAASRWVIGPAWPVGTSPRAVASGVFDDRPGTDLAVVNFGSDDVTVLLSDGARGFTLAQALPVGRGPVALATGDLNRDGRADLVTVNQNEGSLTVLLGDGRGRFSVRGSYPVGSSPRSVALGDLDRDGYPDAMVADPDIHHMTILLGAGDGSLRTVRRIATLPNPLEVASADLNRDGHLDMVVTHGGAYSSYLSVLLGTGGGLFLRPLTTNLVAPLQALSLGDLDRDNVPDAVCGRPLHQDLIALRGAGDGSWRDAIRSTSAMSGASALLLTDLNTDGCLDVAAVSPSNNRLSIFFNSCTSNLWGTSLTYTIPGRPSDVATGDWNADGALDLAVVCQDSNQVTVLWDVSIHALAEEPAGTGLRHGRARGSLAPNGDVDYWVFEGRAGHSVMVAADTSFAADQTAQLAVILQDSEGRQLTYANPARFLELGTIALTNNGAYYIRISSSGVVGEYRLRVSLIPPTWAAERENNGYFSDFNSAVLQGDLRNQRVRVFGAVKPQDIDVYRLQWAQPFLPDPMPLLPVGSEIRLQVYSFGATPALLQVGAGPRGNGDVRGLLWGGTNLVTGISNAEPWFVAVNTLEGGGFDSLYLLDIEATLAEDVVTPRILSDTLPREGAAVTNVVDRFNLSFSEPMLPTAVNNSFSYDLRGAGADGEFDTEDDVRFRVGPVPAFVQGTNVSLVIQDGPLPPGTYRFRPTASLVDLQGNPVDLAYVRSFRVLEVPGFTLEQASNDLLSTASQLVVGGHSMAAGTFELGVDIAVEGRPCYVVDLSPDSRGRGRLVTANCGSHDLSLWVADERGGFTEAARLPVGQRPVALASGDLNGDGLADLVVANEGDNSIMVLRGHTNGSFEVVQTHPVGIAPRSLALGDVNGDAHPDVMVANSGSSDVSVLIGDGNGFLREVGRFVTPPGPVNIACEDLDADGNRDVVVACETGMAITVLRGLGAGALAAPVTLPVLDRPRALAVGDVTGDTLPDIVGISGARGRMWVLQTHSSGGLFFDQFHALPHPFHQVILEDLNSDGWLDLAAAGLGPESLMVSINRNGQFEGAHRYAGGTNATSIASGDWNRDGIRDLAVTLPDAGRLRVWWGVGVSPLHGQTNAAAFGYAFARGGISSTNDVDLWSFSMASGGALILSAYVVNPPPSIQLSLQVKDPFGAQLYQGTLAAGSPVVFPPVLATSSGRHGLAVSASTPCEYRLHVVVLPPSWTAEVEDGMRPRATQSLRFFIDRGETRARAVGRFITGDDWDPFVISNAAPGQRLKIRTMTLPGYELLGGVPLFSVNLQDGTAAQLGAFLSAGAEMEISLPPNVSSNLLLNVRPVTRGYSDHFEQVLLLPEALPESMTVPPQLQSNLPAGYAALGEWSPGAEWTVEAWVWGGATTDQRLILGRGELPDAWGLGYDAGSLVGYVPRGTGSLVVLKPLTRQFGGRWLHVAGTWDGSRLRLYTNGQPVLTSSSITGSVPGAALVYIGKGSTNAQARPPRLMFDEVAFWNRALAPEEIRVRATNRLTGGETGLSGLWRFDDVAERRVTDSSPLARHGILFGPAEYHIVGPSNLVSSPWMSLYGFEVALEKPGAPAIVQDSLPPEGAIETNVVEGFTLRFSEFMDGSSLRNPSAYDLREIGNDGVWDTMDDTLWQVLPPSLPTPAMAVPYTILRGPLPPGRYRLTIRGLRDAQGVELASTWRRHFQVAPLPGTTIEQELNDFGIGEDSIAFVSVGSGVLKGTALGTLNPAGDEDWWRFEVRPGEAWMVGAQVSSGSLSFVLSNRQDVTAWASGTVAGTNALALPPTIRGPGAYALRVASQGSPTAGTYQLHVWRFLNGIQAEREPNSGTGLAVNALTYITNENVQTATVGGFIASALDVDAFGLGYLSPGTTAFLRVRPLQTSSAEPRLEVRLAGSSTLVAEDAGGYFGDDVARITVRTNAAYEVVVRHGQGTLGLTADYLLDVALLPVENATYPNLVVTVASWLGPTVVRSGDVLAVAFSVVNHGQVATTRDSWEDWVFLSADRRLDPKDILLSAATRVGPLAPGSGYAGSTNVKLPDGIQGTYWLIVVADATNAVDEFFLDADNDTVITTPVSIRLADYCDLRVEDFQVLTPDQGGNVEVRWSLVNRGTADSPQEFHARILVQHLGGGTGILEQTEVIHGPLTPGSRVARRTSFVASAPGTYAVTVEVDIGQVAYEHDGVSHESAEANNKVTSYVDLDNSRPWLQATRDGWQVSLEWPAPCEGCELWESRTLGAEATWSRSTVPVQRDGDRYRAVIPIDRQPRFFRLVRP